MLSASTSRLVDGAANLAEPELARVKGTEEPVEARRLLGMAKHDWAAREDSVLVGRRWEMSAIEGLLEGAIEGHGAVVGLVGPPGIGKSRVVREVAQMAGRRDVEVARTFCESHTDQVPFHTIAGLLRAVAGVEGLEASAARARIRAGIPSADVEDSLLLDDLLGIREPEFKLPPIDPDARRRRLTALVNAASLARENPAVVVIEDAQWIDEVSESMVAEFLTVVPQAPLLVIVAYRPEYRGMLTQIPGSQTIALAPLRDSETAALITGLLGEHPSVSGLTSTVADRAAGNPFFAEEIVRELAERGVLQGKPGAYVSTADIAEVSVPATLQTTIAARIDRLDPKAKRTLTAAAVVGSRFGLDLLEALGVEPVTDDLIAAQLIDQVTFTRQPEYVFKHPLIRAVAYESQLKSDRAELHRRFAVAIEAQGAADKNAALIAEHLESAGDRREAFSWHMRAGSWSGDRDIRAARINWERALRVAEALPAGDPERTEMLIAPRTSLCATTWRVGGRTDNGFDELRKLCESVGDDLSLAIGMYGQITSLFFSHRYREASRLASEQYALLQRCPDAVKAAGFIHGMMLAKVLAGEAAEAYRVGEWGIDLVGGDAAKGMRGGTGSPLAMTLLYRGVAGTCLGYNSLRADMKRAIAAERALAPDGVILLFLISVGSTFSMHLETSVADEQAMADTEEAVRVAEQIGDDVALGTAYMARGLVLSRRNTDAERKLGLEFLLMGRDVHVQQGILTTVAMAETRIAELTAEIGDVDLAIQNARNVVETLVGSGEMLVRSAATAALVQSLLMRGTPTDVEEAAAEIERLAAVPTEPGFMLIEIQLLRMRAVLAHATGDEASYRDYAARYRAMAISLGFEGHMALAEAMR